MEPICLRPVEPERDFEELAALFSLEQDEPTTRDGLLEDYALHQERILRLMAAVGENGELLGFNWATRSRFNAEEAYFFVIVQPDQRGQGVGRALVADVEQAARAAEVRRLQVDVRDTVPAYRSFADRCGFAERSHRIGMALDLPAFDDRAYDRVIDGLQEQGFLFTSMEALGNTEEAQRKLYALNDSAAMDSSVDDVHPWQDFADFQKRVCGADWYRPGGQMVVIDTATGAWAAMSAITRFAGAEYAYNLFTGVDRAYRGRKLAQAVKTLALRYARDVLGAERVQTHHLASNAAMIAIDRKLGYVQTPGWFDLVKEIV